MSKLKKYVEENKNTKNTDLEIIDRGVSNLTDAPGLCELTFVVVFLQYFSYATTGCMVKLRSRGPSV